MQLHQIVYCLQNPIITFSITAPKAKKNITPQYISDFLRHSLSLLKIKLNKFVYLNAGCRCTLWLPKHCLFTFLKLSTCIPQANETSELAIILYSWDINPTENKIIHSSKTVYCRQCRILSIVQKRCTISARIIPNAKAITGKGTATFSQNFLPIN